MEVMDMTRWIEINTRELGAIYPVDTNEEIKEVQRVLRMAGIPQVDVYEGAPYNPDSPEAHKTGQVIFAQNENE
jgi:hypothetical protein